MNIHKEFIDQLIYKRKGAFRDFIVGDDSLNLPKFAPNMRKLIEELDQIFYTIEFLKNENLIKTVEYHNTEFLGLLFDGFAFLQNPDLVHLESYWYEKLKRKDFSLGIEVLPGLLSFKNNDFRTQGQVSERKNLITAVLIGLSSAAMTAILTAVLTKAPVIYCLEFI